VKIGCRCEGDEVNADESLWRKVGDEDGGGGRERKRHGCGRGCSAILVSPISVSTWIAGKSNCSVQAVQNSAVVKVIRDTGLSLDVST
jgi:hypothetical protein